MPGWVVIEEAVQSAIEAELAAVYAAIGDSSIDDYLALVFSNLPQGKRDRLKAYLSKRDVKVLVGYPRTKAELPCIALTLDPEQETEFVGETGVRFIDDDTTRTTEASAWTSTIGALVYSEHGELTRWLYQIAKYGLARRRQALSQDGGVIELHLSGRDFGFDPRFFQAGEFVYRRALQVTVTYHQHDLRERDEVDDVELPEEPAAYVPRFTPPA